MEIEMPCFSETLGYEAVLCPDLVPSLLPRNIPGSAAVVSGGKHEYLGLKRTGFKGDCFLRNLGIPEGSRDVVL